VVAGGSNVPVPAPLPIPHGWGDVLGIRLGGDWNIIPGAVAARVGFHTEIPITQSRYQIQDFISGYRFGLHLGATLAFLERFKVHVAYAHMFYQATEVAVGTGLVKDIASIDEAKSTGVNEGRFTAALNVFSLQLNAAF